MVKQKSARDVAPALDRFLAGIGAAEAFETLAALLPDAAVFAVDAERTLVHWSPGAERLLGDGADQVVGRMCLQAIRCRECLLGCGIAERGVVNGFGLELYRTDRQIVPVRKYARGFFDADGRLLLAHCPENYCQLELEDATTGQALTASGDRKPSDFFHSRLSANPSGTRFLSAGWVWHPWSAVVTFDVGAALNSTQQFASRCSSERAGLAVCQAS